MANADDAAAAPQLIDSWGKADDLLCDERDGAAVWSDADILVTVLRYQPVGVDKALPWLVFFQWDGYSRIPRELYPFFGPEQLSGSIFLLSDGAGNMLAVAQDGPTAQAWRFRDGGDVWSGPKSIEYATLYLYANPLRSETAPLSHFAQAYDHGLIAVTSTPDSAPFEKGEQAAERVLAFDWDLLPRWEAPVPLVGKGKRAKIYTTTRADDGGIWILYHHGDVTCQTRADGWSNCGYPLFVQHVTADGKLSFP